MKWRSFIVAMTALVLTTSLLYGIGELFNISWFIFHYEYVDIENDYRVTAGSVIPFFIGLLASYISEKIYEYRYKQKLG